MPISNGIIFLLHWPFVEPQIQFFSSIEQLLLKAINGDPYELEFNELKNYHDDINVSSLPAELQVFRSICTGDKVEFFEDITRKIKTRSKEERGLIINVIKIIKLVLVGAATSATPERSFSLARWLKTWLRSTMTQKRFNSLAILSTHQLLTDGLSLVNLANEFVDGKPNRLNVFGRFSESDLSLDNSH